MMLVILFPRRMLPFSQICEYISQLKFQMAVSIKKNIRKLKRNTFFLPGFKCRTFKSKKEWENFKIATLL